MKKILKSAEVFRYGTACRVTDGPGRKDADNSGVSLWDSTWSDSVGKQNGIWQLASLEFNIDISNMTPYLKWDRCSKPLLVGVFWISWVILVWIGSHWYNMFFMLGENEILAPIFWLNNEFQFYSKHLFGRRSVTFLTAWNSHSSWALVLGNSHFVYTLHSRIPLQEMILLLIESFRSYWHTVDGSEIPNNHRLDL